jgi:hypothetical protein
LLPPEGLIKEAEKHGVTLASLPEDSSVSLKVRLSDHDLITLN